MIYRGKIVKICKEDIDPVANGFGIENPIFLLEDSAGVLVQAALLKDIYNGCLIIIDKGGEE